MKKKVFCISVGDEAYLTEDEIWPDGDAPENPTTEDVIKLLKETGSYRVQQDWGFEFHAEVDGKVAF